MRSLIYDVLAGLGCATLTLLMTAVAGVLLAHRMGWLKLRKGEDDGTSKPPP
jgi:hypothetical protein